MPDWTREGVDAAKATADVSPDGTHVVLAQDTNPADGLQAARELLGDAADFSHIKHGYPVYTAE
jgi:hypothetical protein